MSEAYHTARASIERIGNELCRWACSEDSVEPWESFRARCYDDVNRIANGTMMPHEVREALGPRGFGYLKEEHKARKNKEGR